MPDAFRNPDYIRFAVKGAIAGFICYLIFTLTAYPNIYTSVITCIVCSLSTIGASVQKGVLRLAGSALGGVLGVLTLTYIFPNLDSIGGFWVPFAAVTALAAYITFGSPAISYGGYQIGLAFYKCVLQSYGPYTELRVVRDRLLGILLGLAVFGVINTQLWPVKALAATRAKLASALRTLAKLAGLPDDTKELAPRLAEAYELRLLAYQDFGAVQQLLDGAKFEPGAAPSSKAGRNQHYRSKAFSVRAGHHPASARPASRGCARALAGGCGLDSGPCWQTRCRLWATARSEGVTTRSQICNARSLTLNRPWPCR